MSDERSNINGTVSEWKPQTNNVSRANFDSDTGKVTVEENNGVDFIEAGTVLICSGPATLEAASTNGREVRVIPIGMIEQASVQQSRPLQRIFEIGSKISYIIPGRTVGGMAINRMLFDGPSLLKMLVMGEVESVGGDGSPPKNDEDAKMYKAFTPDKFVEVSNPGIGNINLNFMSSLFELPFGMMMYFQNQGGQDKAAVYFEGCRMSSHSFGIASQATVIAESVNLEFTRVVPVKVAFDGPAATDD